MAADEEKTLEERAAILEQAVAERLNIDLRAFDPFAAVAAHRAAVEQAKRDAVAAVTAAAEKAVSELSVEDRFARLERAVVAATGRSLDEQ